MPRHVGATLRTIGRSALLRFTALGLNFLSSILLARTLGKGEFGEYVIHLAWVVLAAGVLAGGLVPALTRHLPTVEGGFGRRDVALWCRVPAMACTAVIFTAAIALVLARVVTPQLAVAGALAALCYSIDRMRYAVDIAAGRVVPAQVPETLIVPGLVALSAGMITAGILPANHVIAFLSWSAAWVAAMTFGAVALLPRLGSGSAEAWGQDRWAIVRGWREQAPPAAVQAVSGNLEVLVLGAVLSPQAAGPYRVAQQLASFVLVAQSMFASAIANAIPQAARRGKEQLMSVSDRFTGYYCANSAFWLVAYAVLGVPLVRLGYGAEYMEAVPILLLLTAARFVTSGTGPSLTLLTLVGSPISAFWATGAGVVVTALFAFLLGPVWGGAGVACAVLVSVTITESVMAIMVRRELGFDPTGLGALRRRRGSSHG